jgi:hypothetical protein
VNNTVNTDLSLSHVRLNFNERESSYFKSSEDVLIRLLLPLLDGHDGQIPGLPHWTLWLEWLQQPQAFRFMVLPTDGEARPILGGYTCVDAQSSPGIWDSLRTDHERIRASLAPDGMWRPASKRPPRAPWMGVWLTADAIDAGPDLAEILKFEHLLGWAAIYNNRSGQQMS